MRALAFVGLKLLGVLQFYWAAEIIPQLFNGVAMLAGPKAAWYFAAIIIWSALSFLFGYFLVFQTDRVIASLRIPAEPIDASISAPAFLRIGLVILGVSILISAISETAQVLFSAAFNSKSSLTWYASGILAGAFVKFILALLAIGASANVASRIFPKSEIGIEK